MPKQLIKPMSAAAVRMLNQVHELVHEHGRELAEQLAEIDENLCRAELTPTQEAEHLARRKEVWEAMEGAARVEAAHAQRDLVGEKLGQVDAVSSETKGGRGKKEFASSTAEVTGRSKETINRAIRRATEVCQEARDLIRGTALDTGAFLDRLIKRGFTDEEQVQHVSEQLDAIAAARAIKH